jgi:hypothetical protein
LAAAPRVGNVFLAGDLALPDRLTGAAVFPAFTLTAAQGRS